jgi:NADH:ubiquinone oxidoreductase subunit 3 (subunit A)
VNWTNPLVLTLPIALLAALLVAALLRHEAPAEPPHPEMHPRNAWRQYHARYALLVIAFVVFEMEMAFMYPWAVAFRRMGAVAFGDMLVFVGILGVALVYMWRTGVLDLEQREP